MCPQERAQIKIRRIIPDLTTKTLFWVIYVETNTKYIVWFFLGFGSFQLVLIWWWMTVRCWYCFSVVLLCWQAIILSSRVRSAIRRSNQINHKLIYSYVTGSVVVNMRLINNRNDGGGSQCSSRAAGHADVIRRPHSSWPARKRRRRDWSKITWWTLTSLYDGLW